MRRMRLRTLVRWAVFLAVVLWIGYTVAGAGWSYYTVQELVDRSLREASDRHRAAFAAGTQRAVDTLVESLRSSILLEAARDGVPLDESDVDVSANVVGYAATVRWSYPVLRIGRAELLVIPLSVNRSVAVSR
jgi:hypothetical protein